MLGETMGDLARSRSAEAIAMMQMLSAQTKARETEKELEETKKQLEQAQLIILDWMHTNEAFRRVARVYGKRLNILDEQRQMDLDEQILDLAKEDPKFKGSAPHQSVLQRRCVVAEG